ncbi:hypothetical protein D3C80_1417640 [compost metagenome]
MSDIYQDNGFDSRTEYLESLSEDYGVDIDTIRLLADLLGPEEDFDGLVSTLQDM